MIIQSWHFLRISFLGGCIMKQAPLRLLPPIQGYAPHLGLLANNGVLLRSSPFSGVKIREVRKHAKILVLQHAGHLVDSTDHKRVDCQFIMHEGMHLAPPLMRRATAEDKPTGRPAQWRTKR